MKPGIKAASQQFEAIKTKYLARREHFQKVINSLTSRSSKSTRMRGLQLLDDADKLMRELTNDLSITAEGQADPVLLQKKLVSFKKTYKELHELTKPVWRQWIEAIVVALVLAMVLRNFVFGLYHVPTGSAEKTILVGDRIWGNKMAYFFSNVKRGELVIFDNPTFDYERVGSFKYYWQRYIGLPIPFLGIGAGPDNWVKRVIAIPGDTIEGRMENGKTVVYRNGKRLDEEYVNMLPLIALHKSHGLIPLTNLGPIQIPGFLRYETKEVHYTYDPSQPFDQQPYYCMTPEEIIRRPDNNQPVLLYPFTPTPDYRTFRNVDVFGPFRIPEGKYWMMGDSRKNSVDSRTWLFLDERLIHGRASFVIYSVDSEEAFWLFDLIKHPIDFWTKHVRWNRLFKGLNGYTISNEPGK